MPSSARKKKAAGEAPELRDVDTDREIADSRLAATRCEHELTVGRLHDTAVGAAMLGDKISGEVFQFGFGFDPDWVVLQQLRQQPVVVGQHRDHFWRRERNVEKKSHCIGVTALPQLVFYSDPTTTEIYTLSLHDALPI